MTSDEQISILRAMVGTDEAESVLASFLSLAGSKIINRAYPFNPNVSTVPERYRSLQVEIAAYMMNKRGAEGQTGHSENGVSRTYGSADVPEAMLSAVTPYAGVISHAESQA